MQSLRISRPTPAFFVALIALICALGGSAYAAAAIDGKSVKKRSLPANRVVLNSLGGNQVNESLLAIVPLSEKANSATNAEKALTADKATTADSATTAETAANAEKLGGQPPSAYQKAGFTTRVGLVEDVAANATVEKAATCQAGEVAVAGGAGFYIVNTTTSIASATLSASVPNANGTSWQGEGKNTSPVARDFRAWVVCAQG